MLSNDEIFYYCQDCRKTFDETEVKSRYDIHEIFYICPDCGDDLEEVRLKPRPWELKRERDEIRADVVRDAWLDERATRDSD